MCVCERLRSFFQAKVDNEIIDYRDLAAIPRVKAIYDIEHPDMISYKSVNSCTLDDGGDAATGRSLAEVTPSDTHLLSTHHSIKLGFYVMNLHKVELKSKGKTQIFKFLYNDKLNCKYFF